jgi:hypothetical protein
MTPYTEEELQRPGGYVPCEVERVYYNARLKFENGAEPFRRQMVWLVSVFREPVICNEGGVTYRWTSEDAKTCYDYLEERVRLWMCECFDRNPDGTRRE